MGSFFSLKEREKASDGMIRLFFLAYAGFVAAYGVYWIRVILTPVENSCKTGVIQGTIMTAVCVGGFAGVASAISVSLAARPPRRWGWGSWVMAVGALALVSYMGYGYIQASRIDWCGGFG